MFTAVMSRMTISWATRRTSRRTTPPFSPSARGPCEPERSVVLDPCFRWRMLDFLSKSDNVVWLSKADNNVRCQGESWAAEGMVSPGEPKRHGAHGRTRVWRFRHVVH